MLWLLVSLPGTLDSSSILILATDHGNRFPAKWLVCPTASEKLDLE